MNIIRQPDPFRYGYRYVARTDAHGQETFIMMPLTEEDILHPQMEDHVTQNPPHVLDCIYLFNVFQIILASRPDALVLMDHLIQWGITGMGDHGPDITVVLGLPPDREQRDSFKVPVEGVRPELIIEITSPATRGNDLNIKPKEYWQCRVPYYVIVDELRRRRQRQLRILGYRYGKSGYRPMRLNAQGRLWLKTVGLWLGHEEGRVVCYNQQGQAIPEPREAIQRAEQAEQERLQAQQRAELAEQQVKLVEQERLQDQAEIARLQAELRRLRGKK